MKLKRIPLDKITEYISLNARYYDSRVLRLNVANAEQYALIIGEINADGYYVYEDLSDWQVLKLQLILAIPGTVKNVEYSRYLLRLLAIEPKIMLKDFAGELNVSEQWIKDRLGISDLVPMDRVCVSNATVLSKINNLVDWVERAMTFPPSSFYPMALAEVKSQKQRKKEIVLFVSGEKDFNLTCVTQEEAKNKAFEFMKRGFTVKISK